MKRLLLLVVLFTVSCSQTQVAGTVRLVGTHDLALVGDLLFVTSTDRDEVRVLDLTPTTNPQGLTAGIRTFVRAPNPLEALSIPVLRRPSSLTRDVHYVDYTDPTGVVTPLGTDVGGPWVYATRAGGSEISIIAAKKGELFEVHGSVPGQGWQRIPTSAPVTATAGYSLPNGTSRLYFATSNGDSTAVRFLDLPGTLAELRALPVGQVTRQTALNLGLDGQVVVDMVVVPGLPGRGICEVPTQECLVLATREQSGRSGRVLLFDPISSVSRELHFPGPVRSLAIHAAAAIGNTTFGPGRRVWAILNEEQCGGIQCSGVIAVDTFTGEVATQDLVVPVVPTPPASEPQTTIKSYPMTPITVGNALPTGLSIATHAPLLLPGGTATGTIGTWGVVSTSTGQFFFFDAANLNEIDLDELTPAAAKVRLVDPTGAVRPYAPGPIVADPTLATPEEIRIAAGAWESQQVQIFVNGQIPGLIDVPTTDAEGSSFPVYPEIAALAEVGDVLEVLTPLSDGIPVCSVTISEVTPTALRVPDPLPEACTGVGRNRFRVRAAGTDPYVIIASVNGYLGRSGPGKTFSASTPYFQHVNGYDPTAPTLTLQFASPHPADAVPDSFWEFDLQSHFAPFNVAIDSTSVGCLTLSAGSVVFDSQHAAVFVLYPSANGVVEFNPRTAVRGTTTSNAVCFR